MQEEYTARLLKDGHISIPKEIIDKLKIDKESKLRVTVEMEGKAKKEKILAYAGLLSEVHKYNRGEHLLRRGLLFPLAYSSIP
jgi:hypothetical protein